MASIRKVVILKASADKVWAAIRDLGRLPKLAPGAVAESRMDDDMRVTVYAGEPEIREWVVDLDDTHRRLAMTATGGIILHHNSAIEVFDEGENRARVVWVCDFLPDVMMGEMRKIMNRSVASAKKVLEAEAGKGRKPAKGKAAKAGTGKKARPPVEKGGKKRG